MKKYKYYSLADENEEAIGVIEAKTIDEAIILASDKKKLVLSEFLKIFRVKEVK